MRLKIFNEELPLAARLYVLAIFAIGLPLFGYCLIRAIQREPPQWLLLVFLTCSVSTVVSVRAYWVFETGPKPRRSPQSVLSTPADFFVLSAILFFSPEVAALVGGCDTLFVSFLDMPQSRRYRSWFNLSVLCLLAWLCGKFFYWTQGLNPPLNPASVEDPLWLVLCLYATAVLHIFANACLVGVAVYLSSGHSFVDQLRGQVWFAFSGLVGATGVAAAFFLLRDHYWLSWLAAVPVVLIAQQGNYAISGRINALLESRNLLRDSLDGLTASVAVLDEKRRLLAVNQAWKESLALPRLFGAWIREGEDYRQACQGLASEVGDAETVLEAIESVLAGERPQRRLDYNCAPAAPGVWFQLGVSSFQSSLGIRVIVSHQEISDLKLSEQRVRESERKYRRFFEEDLTGDFVADGDGILTDCNPAFARILGFPSAEGAIGFSLLNLFLDPGQGEELVRRLRRSEKLECVEVDLRTVEGAQVNVVANLGGRVENGDHLTEIRGYLFDDTRRKKLEARVTQARKMDAVGQLAGGIAHEFNNSLTVVTGCADFLKRSLNGHKELAVEATFVLDAASQGSRLTRRFQVFSQDEAGAGEVVVLDHLVQRMEPTLRNVVGNGVRLEIRLEAGEARLTADAAQIEQVILNLVVNARDAMPEGGELRLETLLSDSPDWPIRLRVTDTGLGMSEQVRKRIFEPFFTTKPGGSGTGLGLATVYGILQQSGGRIEVESELGRGSSFELFFPTSETLHQPERFEIPTGASLRGCETILLVEDQSQVREMIGRTLREQGYRVLVAPDGVEALRLAEAHEGPIQLLLTDIVMPRMSGWELARRVRDRFSPRTRILFVTGYANRPGDLEKAAHPPAFDRLDKPFTPEALLRRVRAILDAGRPPREEGERLRGRD